MKRALIHLLAYFIAVPGAAHATETSALTVDEVVHRVLAANDAVAAAQAENQAAAAARDSARADRLPRLDASYGYRQLSETPVTRSGGTALTVGHDREHSWQVSLRQPLFTGFALTAQTEIAEYQTGIGTAVLERSRQSAVRDAKIAAYDILLAEKLLVVAEEAVAALAAHVGDARLFFEQGLIPRNDLLRSEVALADARQEQRRADASLELARTRLALLLEWGDAGSLRIVDPGPPPEASVAGENLAAEALHLRPELRAQRLARRQLESQVTLARSRYLPQVDLVAAYEQAGEDLGGRNNAYGNQFNRSVAVRAEWNLFEWGKTRAEVGRARHGLQAEDARIRQLEDRVRIEVRQAYLDLQVSHGNIATAASALEQARENSRITGLQYQQQIATSTDVLDARAFLTEADSNYFRARYGYLAALANLDHALGRPLGAPGDSVSDT